MFEWGEVVRMGWPLDWVLSGRSPRAFDASGEMLLTNSVTAGEAYPLIFIFIFSDGCIRTGLTERRSSSSVVWLWDLLLLRAAGGEPWNEPATPDLVPNICIAPLDSCNASSSLSLMYLFTASSLLSGLTVPADQNRFDLLCRLRTDRLDQPWHGSSILIRGQDWTNRLLPLKSTLALTGILCSIDHYGP